MNADILTRRAMLGGLALFPASRAIPQGFAGLGTDVDGFARPDPDRAIRFPRDHAPHPRFRIEWWYVTANLTGSDGTPYGIQWTLFRSALHPDAQGDGWQSGQAWLGHAALTTPERHFTDERLARGGIGVADVTLDPFDAHIDDWSFAGATPRDARLKAAGPAFAYDLGLRTDKPFVLQGNNGYSVKSAAGQASHYYSQPFYRVDGTLRLPDREIAVTGQAWLDREWSSQPLASDQSGWDWFSLHLASGDKLMAFRLRGATDFTAATWIAPDAQATPFEDGAFRAEPLSTSRVNGIDVPTTWRAALPARDLDVTVTALNPDAWMPLSFPYWEGPVTVAGSHDGIGYLEMTGYG